MHEQIAVFSVSVGSSIQNSETMHRNKILCRYMARYIATYIGAEQIVMTFNSLRICRRRRKLVCIMFCIKIQPVRYIECSLRLSERPTAECCVGK
jgi:hypothetical protein